jgi:hypothetical protein
MFYSAVYLYHFASIYSLYRLSCLFEPLSLSYFFLFRFVPYYFFDSISRVEYRNAMGPEAARGPPLA